MSIATGYFNSSNGDRKYNAETMSNYFVGILTKGVLANYAGGFVVKQNSGMSIQVAPGRAFFADGKWIESDATEVLTIDTADVALNRIDRVVLHKDISDVARTTTLIVKKGSPSSNPTPPEVEQNDYIEELSLATVFVSSKATTVTQGSITDTRPDATVCGFVTGVVDQLDLTDAYQQYQAGYEETMQANQQEFDEWFDDVKEEFAAATLVRAYESTYTTTEDTESEIPIQISKFNRNLDILQVYINGLKLVQNQDFTLDSNTEITLTKAVYKNTPINFVVYKSIDDVSPESIDKLKDVTDEITTATRQIVNAAYFNDISSANPGMSISGLAENDTVYVYGRNLAPKIPAQEKNGLTLTQNADGSVTINGTATGDSSTTFSVSGNVTLPAGSTFTFSGCTTGSNSTYRMYVYQPGWQQCFLVHGATSKPITNFAVTSKPITVTMTQTLPVTITVLVPSGQTVDNVTFYPMCELGETTRGYVPYIEAESYTANSNGHVSCVPPQPEATVITGKICTVEYNQNTQIAAANAERRINQTATNALIGTKAGTVVRLDGVSPMPHYPKVEITGATADGTSVVNPVVKAYGKNLLDLDTYQMETQTINGVTITNYGNGYFELTGTPTEAQTVQLDSSQFYASDGLNIYPPGTYTASEGITVTLRKAADNSGIGNKSGTFTVDEAFYISQWYVFVTSAGVVGGTNGKTTPFGFRPQLEAGDTATDYEAYKEPQSYSYTGTLGTNNRFTLPDGTFDSVYPTMTMTVTNDNSGTVEGSLTVQYNRDINAAFNELAAAIAAQA